MVLLPAAPVADDAVATDHARAARAALREVRDDGVAPKRARCFPPKTAGMKRQVTLCALDTQEVRAVVKRLVALVTIPF